MSHIMKKTWLRGTTDTIKSLDFFYLSSLNIIMYTTKNKGAYQTERVRMVICILVFPYGIRQVVLWRGSYSNIKY